MKKNIAYLRQFFSGRPVEQKTTHQKFSESVAEAVRRMQEATPEEKAEMEKFEREVRYAVAVKYDELYRRGCMSVVYGLPVRRRSY